MRNDLTPFRTVRELLVNRDEVLMSNAVDTEGKLYADSVENLTAILAMKQDYDAMRSTLNAMVFNYAQFGRVTDNFVYDVARMMTRIGDIPTTWREKAKADFDKATAVVDKIEAEDAEDAEGAESL